MILKGRAGVLSGWQYECAAHLLPELWELGAGMFTELFRHLFPMNEDVTPAEVSMAYNDVIIELAIRRHYDAALSIGAPFYWGGPENILAMVARYQAGDRHTMPHCAGRRENFETSGESQGSRPCGFGTGANRQKGGRPPVLPAGSGLGTAGRGPERPYLRRCARIAVQQAKAGEIAGAFATERKMAAAPSETPDHAEAVRADVLAEIAEAEHRAGK